MKMDSAERMKIFRTFAGENADTINLLFEEKLILKNKLQGIKNWVNKVGEMGIYDPEKKAKMAELLSDYRNKQQERMFNPKEEEGFLGQLVEEKLGIRISRKQAKVAWDMQLKVNELFKQYDKKTEKWTSKKDAFKYGAAKVIYNNYINNFKTGDMSAVEMFKSYGQDVKESWQDSKYKTIAKVVSDSISTLSNTLISSTASWDNSFMGRQGAITITKSPKSWWNMARRSFSDFYKTLKGQNPQDVLMANVYADPDYINGNYDKAKITFGIEEEVPIQILERIPALGRLFKASDTAFVDSAIRAKISLFKIQKNIYDSKRIKLDDTRLKDVGKIVNSIVGRGQVGQIGSSAPVRLLMWAPKMLKADWDVLTGHTFGFGLETKEARIQAADTILRVVIATAAISAVAAAFGADVEDDPRSTDFLKIKIGNTRINTPFARGMPQLITLISRILTRETKSSTGIISKLNSGEYGSKSVFDVGLDFLVNKTTPPASTVIAWTRGRDFSGKKPTLGKTAFRFLPISVQNFIELKDEKTAIAVIGAFIDLLGVSTNTYSQETDWGESNGKELLQFKEKVGEEKFKEANDLFNERYSEWLITLKDNDKYKALTDEEKKKILSNKKTEIKKDIFEEYKFKYKQEKLPPLPKI
jgi:hypothetical protein